MAVDEADRRRLEGFYRRYLQGCNEHRFRDLGEFVAQDVEVNGAAHGLWNYSEGLAGVVRMYPVDGGKISAVWGDLDQDRLAA